MTHHNTYNQITDGFGNYYPAYCLLCHFPNEVVRPGKFQCSEGCNSAFKEEDDACINNDSTI